MLPPLKAKNSCGEAGLEEAQLPFPSRSVQRAAGRQARSRPGSRPCGPVGGRFASQAFLGEFDREGSVLYEG